MLRPVCPKLRTKVVNDDEQDIRAVRSLYGREQTQETKQGDPSHPPSLPTGENGGNAKRCHLSNLTMIYQENEPAC
ncbi:MAG: hypothetical protein QF721_08290 [Verrucomicrobiota bacterium]|jgi:hypothetical protein|nr:hypothetical protein [Verrucomicrobiota bacterium]MDP7049435.1 hypothetical protein [Verrucomicrobiota bacterium]